MSLREWYGEREVLLTGVTSQFGTNLLEKLLRSFPDVKIHVVLRTRDGMTKTDRVKKRIYESPGFERLRQEQTDAMSRVMAYEGNLVYDDCLGMSKRSVAAMTNVSVVFHAAGPYKSLLKYCQELPNLKAVVVATDLYSCKEEQVLEDTITDEDIPNDLPLTLIRLPPIGPAYRDPMPGYVELLKGATALMVGAGYMKGRADLPVQIIPMDIASNTLIAAAWDSLNNRIRMKEPFVYNSATIECNWGELIKKGNRANRKFRYPSFRIRGITSSAPLHWIIVVLFEWLPSFICDTVYFCLGQKPRMLPEYRRIRKLLSDFEEMTTRIITVERRRYIDLQKHLIGEDKETFQVNAQLDIEAYILCAAAATRRYCVNENNLKIVTFFLPTIVALVLIGWGVYYYFSEYIFLLIGQFK